MLAVVEHEQRALSLDRANEVLQRVALGRKPESERLRNSRWDVVAAGKRCEFDEPATVGATVEQIRRDLQHCARLADACRPNQRDEAMLLDERDDFGDLRVAPNK